MYRALCEASSLTAESRRPRVSSLRCVKGATPPHEIFGDNETMKNCERAYTFEKTRQFLNEFCIGKSGALAAVLNRPTCSNEIRLF